YVVSGAIASLDGVLIEAMGQRGLEMIIGARNDPQWGPVILAGLGGVTAEIMRDARLLDADLSTGEVLRERLGSEAARDLRLDWIGVASVLGDDAGRWRDAQPASATAPQDVRLRAAWLRPTQAEARRLPREVNALYTCGPAGGGGVRTALRARLGTVSCLLAQQSVATGWKWAEEDVDKGVGKEAGE
ncbi:acetate--CoA ligase family protein, partial [Burkholderia sola]|uniref:acetate--CoA ligase family protein n=1 Tax=Burkholderia sola TaxID=2843302 RepID=UPI00338EA666